MLPRMRWRSFLRNFIDPALVASKSFRLVDETRHFRDASRQKPHERSQTTIQGSLAAVFRKLNLVTITSSCFGGRSPWPSPTLFSLSNAKRKPATVLLSIGRQSAGHRALASSIRRGIEQA